MAAGKVEHAPCLCGHGVYVIFLHFGRRKIIQCTRCGLKRTYPKPSSGVYEGALAEQHRSACSGDLHPHVQYIASLAFAFSKIRILDFGCGEGRASLYMKNKGANVVGVEISDELLESARTKGVAVYKSLGEIAGQQFDVIMANHVFEHIENLNHVLETLGKLLTKGGLLIAGVPNVDTPKSRNYNWCWLWESHYWQFGLRSFAETINRTGLYDTLILKALYDHDKCEAENFDNKRGEASLCIAVKRDS